jgi:hypothetical protein
MHIIKLYGEVKVYLHSFLDVAFQVCDQIYGLFAFLRGNRD